MIIGASAESDLQILNLTEKLYSKMSLKRVYYSAYIAVNDEPLLPALLSAPALIREHRLYQADWLLRFYKFQSHEILSPAYPNLDEQIDPKAAWALRNFDLFPIDINKASYEELLRIPGVGLTSARRIIMTRRITAIREQDLKKIGMVLKRARFFITINGKYLGDSSLSHHHLVSAMCKVEPPVAKKLLHGGRQLRLF
jgi:predicted DNA-binding helix-hairpin-helix protein